jgi:hypothetical protein
MLDIAEDKADTWLAEINSPQRLCEGSRWNFSQDVPVLISMSKPALIKSSLFRHTDGDPGLRSKVQLGTCFVDT